MPRLIAIFLSLFSLTAVSQAQVLVYKLDFSKEKGINYSTFQGGFFVAPLLGGSGTFLLTSNEEGLTYTESSEAGRLFTAVNDTAKKSVVSATTGTGTAGGALVAMGDIDFTVHVRGPTYTLDARVARNLLGTAISADDESTLEEETPDRSIGSAGVSTLKMALDEDETNRANRGGLTLAQTVEQVKLTLERQGYSDGQSDPDPDDPDNPDNGDDDDDEDPVVVPPVVDPEITVPAAE